jgi:hypothetical protein
VSNPDLSGDFMAQQIGGLSVSQDPRYKNTPNDPKKQGLGNAVGQWLGFDPTPGFNVRNPLNNNAPAPVAAPKKTAMNPLEDQGYSPYDSGYVQGASTTRGSGYDPASVAAIDAGIGQANNGLGLLDRQQDIGLGDITSSYNNALNRLLGGFSQAERNYNTTKQQTTQDNINTRNDIQSGVGRNANALQRLLGQRGAGNSSAAQIVAPYGAALQGTQQLKGVQNAFGRNMQALDTNWQDYNTEFGQSREDLDRQRYQNENSLRGDIAGRRQSLLNSLAQLTAQKSAANGGSSAAALAAAQPFISQANQVAGQQVDYSRQYANPIAEKAVAYNSPDLAQYEYTNPNIGVDNTSAYTDTVDPALAVLLGLGKRRQNGLA